MNILMEQPLRYIVEGETSKFHLVLLALCRLNYSLHASFVAFSFLLTAYGFTLCTACSFVVRMTCVGLLVLVIFVDKTFDLRLDKPSKF